ncbi:MAG: hypothetical protein U0Q15_15650 [Kineosporiaceae bacterium]
MTVIDQAVRPAVQPSGAATGGATGTPATAHAAPSHRRAESRDAYLLRLSLDLQLDALLLVLGASASGQDGSGIPWRRWLDEDVELAWELTATARTAHAALPATLGTALSEDDAEGVNADLLARYESMCRLLEDLLDAEGGPRRSGVDTTVDLSGAATAARGPASSGTASGAPAERPAAPPWHAHVRAALDRCRTRVEELREHTCAPARAAAAAAAGLSGTARAHLGAGLRTTFLPGELLG